MDLLELLFKPWWILGFALTALVLRWSGVTDTFTLVAISAVIGLPLGWGIGVLRETLLTRLFDWCMARLDRWLSGGYTIPEDLK